MFFDVFNFLSRGSGYARRLSVQVQRNSLDLRKSDTKLLRVFGDDLGSRLEPQVARRRLSVLALLGSRLEPQVARRRLSAMCFRSAIVDVSMGHGFRI